MSTNKTTTVPVSHRGGALEFDENTLTAFENSYMAGLRAFETDVRRTKDGELVIMHDQTATRTTGDERIIEEMTAEEIRGLRTLKTGSRIPFLDDLLDFFAGKETMLQIELKCGDSDHYPDILIDSLCRQVHEKVSAKLSAENYRYSSFDPRPLQALRRLLPDVYIIYLRSLCDSKLIAEAGEIGVSAISCRIAEYQLRDVKAITVAGMVAAGFGAKTLELYQKAIDLGLDFVTVDRPVEAFNWLRSLE